MSGVSYMRLWRARHGDTALKPEERVRVQDSVNKMTTQVVAKSARVTDSPA